MSNYPSWWDSTITIYNKSVDVSTSIVSWKRTVLSGCFWKETGNKTTIGGVTIDTDNITCRIPKQDNFIEPIKYIDLADKSKVFTLQQGDIIVGTLCDIDIDEYTKGARSTDLLSKYRPLRGCMEIKSVAINTMTGMVNPHYSVKGV